MRKIIVVCLLLAVMGCGGVQLTPEMTRIASLNDPAGCKHLADMVVFTRPDDLLQSLQYKTSTAGGDSYRVTSSESHQVQSLVGLNRHDVATTTFEIYKCR